MLGQSDENGNLNKFINQLKEKDALLKERDSKLEELAVKNNLYLEEKLDLKKQLERAQKRIESTPAAGFQSQKTVRVANESFQAAAGTGITQAQLDAEKAEVDRVKT